MVFSSLFFLYFFLPINLILYFVIKNHNFRNIILIITSLIFYAWGEPVWIILLLFTTAFDFINALIVEKYRENWQSKAALSLSIVANLSLLGFFKYSGFFLNNINYLFRSHIPFRDYGLPIGISFYTFQTLSYVIDVYKGDVPAQKSFYKLLLFVSLFHQLVAGPIVRYKEIAEEIDNRLIDLDKFSGGINRFVIGLGKKVIFANTAGEIAEVFLKGNVSTLPILGAWFGILLFAFQIYFDFSGYSDMAIGLGKMFGFTYGENFNYPYISKSATEFWRRWHISLGTFFRDYLYIPLGGNMKNQIRNLIVVWLLTGLWHGASWNFILWGGYYGALIILEKKYLIRFFEKLPAFASHLYLIFVTLIGWVFFYFTDVGTALGFLKVMFGFGQRVWIDENLSIYFLNNVFFIIAAIIACTPLFRKLNETISKNLEGRKYSRFAYNEIFRPSMNFSMLLISTVLLVGKSYNPFLYFRF